MKNDLEGLLKGAATCAPLRENIKHESFYFSTLFCFEVYFIYFYVTPLLSRMLVYSIQRTSIPNTRTGLRECTLPNIE